MTRINYSLHLTSSMLHDTLTVTGGRVAQLQLRDLATSSSCSSPCTATCVLLGVRNTLRLTVFPVHMSLPDITLSYVRSVSTQSLIIGELQLAQKAARDTP